MTDRQWKLVGLALCLISAALVLWIAGSILDGVDEIAELLKLKYGGQP